MLKDKELLDQELTEEVSKLSFDKIELDVIDYIYEHHNISKGTLRDYTTLRKPFSEADPVTEYVFLEAIAEVGDNSRRRIAAKERITAYFTQLEKGKFASYQEPPKVIPEQFRISCLQVSDKQWIGVTDVHFFIQLREAQKIRYNENAQRIMKRVARGSSVEYAITVNWSEVNDIQQKFRNESFISNALTLNIPEDVDTVFHYDEKTRELIFDEITVLDITDGYHRYLAAGAEYDRTNGEFNYPLEIRIVNFSDKKARDFVYQETLGLKMRKVDAQSMNNSSFINFVVDKINEGSNLEGYILRNAGQINYGDFAYALKEYYFDKETDTSRSALLAESKEIIKYINKLTLTIPELLDRIWTYDDILTTVFIMKSYIKISDDEKRKVDLESLWRSAKDLVLTEIPKRSLKSGARITYKYYSVIIDSINKHLGIDSIDNVENVTNIVNTVDIKEKHKISGEPEPYTQMTLDILTKGLISSPDDIVSEPKKRRGRPRKSKGGEL